MPKFRKKPVVIEARHYLNDSDTYSILNWINGHQFKESKSFAEWVNENLFIPTPEGTMQADVGDWIIQGVNGEFYPCKPDIFEKTYEPVN